MLSFDFIKLISSFNSKRNIKGENIIKLGILGIRIVQEYSSRFDLLDIDKCIYLSEFHTSDVQKEERHLLTLLPKYHPLLSQMEYYDNDSYLYSNINYLFKGCLRTGTEISIKVVNESAKTNFTKSISSLEKELRFFSFFFSKLDKKYKIVEMIEKLKKLSEQKLNLNNEIKGTELMKNYLEQYRDFKGFDRLKFGHIYAYLSSENILVSQYIYGTYFYQLAESRRLSYKDVLDVIKIQLFFIFKIGVFHGNLHMGNIILGDKRELYFLDCNVLNRISDDLRENMFKIIGYILKYEYTNIAGLLQVLSKVKIDEEALKTLTTKICDIFKNFKGSYLEKAGVIKNLLLTLRTASEMGMVFDDEIYPLVKSLIYLEDMALRVNPKAYFTDDISSIFTELSLY